MTYLFTYTAFKFGYSFRRRTVPAVYRATDFWKLMYGGVRGSGSEGSGREETKSNRGEEAMKKNKMKGWNTR
jgi:hypothetical protein